MVDEFQVNQFKLDDGPLALVIASVTFAEPSEPSNPQLSNLKQCLNGAGFKNESRQVQRNVTIGGPTPVVDQFTVYQYLDEDRKRGVALTKPSLSYFASNHDGLDDLTNQFESLVSCFEQAVGRRKIQNLGLRYVNVFKTDQIPSPLISNSLTGLGHRGLTGDGGHFHHNYEFWCDTDGGRLHTRYAITHGDRRPEQLGNANTVFPTAKLGSYSDNFCHLDLFENTNRLGREVELEEMKQYLTVLNRRIEQAFLNSVTNEAMRVWGAKKIV